MPAFAPNTGSRPKVGHRAGSSRPGLVYGGGNVGLMGVVADANAERRWRGHRVIPQALVAKEVAHRGLSELRIVDNHAPTARLDE